MGTLAERFWDKVKKGDGCWEWTASRYPCGYGKFKLANGLNGGRAVKAHRQSWQLSNGDIPTGMHVLHRCDNRRCVNPSHLFLGTHADNMSDKAAKCRAPRGSAHASAMLTERDIPFIRGLGLIGFSQTDIAAMYGVSRSAVYLIQTRKKWAHVPEGASLW